MIIGITGSSGSGKSTVCDILEKKYQVKIVNADEIARRLSKEKTEYLADIVSQFGKEILLENGELNRPKLATIIYESSEKRELLNQCTFQYIKKEIQREIEKVGARKNDGKVTIAIDAPLLFEADLQNLCQKIIAVISDNRELQIKRIVERDNITRQQAIARLNAQKSDEFYKSRSNYVLINDGEIRDIEEQIEKILKQIENNVNIHY